MQTALVCLFVCILNVERSLGAVSFNEERRSLRELRPYPLPYVKPGSCYPQCLNGGMCIRNRCICRRQFTGRACEVSLEPIDPEPTYRPYYPDGDDSCSPYCRNGGVCINRKCYCTWEWEGPSCDIRKRIPDYPPPKPIKCNPPCRNGGFCINNKCVCREEYRGPACEFLKPREAIPRDKICYPPCTNGGVCLKNLCMCPKDWKGPSCQYSRTTCSYKTLLDMGANGGLRCEERRQYGNTTVPYTCNLLCDGRFEYPPAPKYTCDYATGRFSPTNIPYCIEDETIKQCDPPCSNDGRCINGLCVCPSGYSGTRCQYHTPDACFPACLNGGRCVEGGVGVGYYCACPRGYTGGHCERRAY